MGTHISRVKSVDLDTWTDEQVRSMVAWGNDKSNQFWEDGLPNNYVPDESKIENFIRTKYDLKKWSKSKQVPDPSQLTASQTPKVQRPASTQPENRRSLTGNLLDLEFGSPVSVAASPKPPAPQQSSSQSLPAVVQPHQYQTQQQTTNQQPLAQQNRDRPELKKSILSLYSTPLAASNSTPNFPLQQQSQPQQQQQLQSPYTNHSTSSINQLNSLNFNSTSSLQNQWSSNNTNNNMSASNSPSFSNSSTSTLNNNINNFNSNASNQWSNVTAAAPAKPLQQTYNNGLDDDLFKNVWK
jgi:stromal membrane-associated protein